MKAFKEFMKKLWAGMDGNKTILGTTLLAVLSNWPLPQPYQAIALLLVTIFTGVSAKQHFVDKQMYRPDKR
jgi:hypothetical protein